MTNNKGKGKAIAGKAPSAKGKLAANDDKTGAARKRNRSVLQFFEDSAYVDDDDDDDSDDSDFADDFLEEEFDTVQPMMTEPPKGGHGNLPFIPKEEEIDEEEFDRMMEERYGEISKFGSFAGDEFDDKIIEDSLVAGVKDPTVWKVKCTVGRERVSAFCLMQKFADLKALGTTLPLISAFAVDHMKGFVYIEAEKQSDIYEGCKGIPGIYASRVQPVPRNEVPHMFSFKSGSAEISEGMWARIKSGNYKGDLAQVVAFNNTRKKVTVKLVPRIDLQAMAAKFGGGYSRQKTAIPAPRLISSSELEEFRPLIQFRRDRDTGKVFEVLDGLLLKDGYVFKKVSPESLNLWGVVPTEEELLKFGPSENNESKDLEWLAQLYGESKKKQRVIRNDKGGGKGESSSGSGVVNGFELYDLVCFGKKDFGVIVGMDKDDSYKILKENPDGSVAVTVERNEIKSGLFDLKLSAQDQHNKAIVVNDTVRVVEGPSEGRQGIVRHIYRGIVFLWDETLEENGGYFTSKSRMCEKVKLTVDDFSGKDGEPGPSVFDDVPSSPRSPLSPKKPWQGKENNREFNRGDNSNSLFSIGQTLRIRIGPLKGYLCRVIALRRTDVTVKLDSQQKVLTVKCEHLSEVQGKSTAVSSSADPDSSSFKPFDILGTEGATGGWMDGVGTSSAGNGWNAGGSSAEGNAWSNHSAPSLLKPEPTANAEEDAAWVTKSTPNQNSSWGAAVENTGISSDADQTGGWGKGAGSWGEAEHKVGSMSDTWKNKGNDSDGNQPSGWGQGNGSKEGSAWGKMKSGSDVIAEKQDSDWGKSSNWNAVSSDAGGSRGSVWGQLIGSTEKKSETDTSTSWGQDGGKSGSADAMKQTSNWGAWKSGSCSGNENKEANWASKCADAGSSHSNWGNKTNWNSGHVGNQASDVNNDNYGSGNSNQTSNWGNKSNWNTNNSFGSAGNENKNSNCTSEYNNAENQDSSWGKKSNLNSGSGDANQSSGWGKKSDWNTNNTSGSAGNENKNSNWSSDRNNADNQDSIWGKKSNWSSGSGDSNQNSILGKKSDWNTNNTTSSTGNENKNSNWSSDCNNAENQDSSWGKKSNWNSGSGDFNQNSSWGKKNNLNADNSFGGAGNENKNSNWSSERKDAENQDSSWGKKSNWNSGSSDKNQNSTWGNKANWNSDNSSGSAGNENKNSNWSSDARNQDSSWGKKSNWTSGSGDKSEGNNWKSNNNWSTGNGSGGDNEGRNETSDDGAGGGNWRGGYRGRGGSDRGGFRGRGFRGREGGGFGGRGERGSFGGRGERGGFGGRGECGGFGGRGGRGRSDGEGFGGRWGSERSFGGRGRGRSDQSGGWNNRRDSGEDGGYSDWKKEGDNAEGWKNSSRSGGWSQEGGDKGKQSWSLENADKERPSWDQGGGSNKQWSSWNSGSGASGGSWNSNGSKQMAEGKGGAGWTSKGDNGSGWRKSNAVEETNVQGGGWNKGPNSSDQDKGGWKSNSGSGSGAGDQVPKWGQSSAADKGQSSGWGQSGTAEKGSSGWGQSGAADKGQSSGWGQSGAADKGQSSGWGQSGAAEKSSSGWGQSGAADKGSSGWGQSAAADKGSSGWGQSGAADKGQSSGWGQSGAADKGQSSGWGLLGAAEKSSSGCGQSGAADKGSSGWGQSGATDKGSSGWGQSSAADKGSSDWGQSGTADDRGQSSGWNRPADGAAGSWGKKNDGSNKDGW